MNIRKTPRTIVRIDVDVDESLREGMSPEQVESLQRFALTFTPCKGGVRWRGSISKTPNVLAGRLFAEGAHAARAAQAAGDYCTATGRWLNDRALLLRYAARLVRRPSFVRRYWPDIAERQADEAAFWAGAAEARAMIEGWPAWKQAMIASAR